MKHENKKSLSTIIVGKYGTTNFTDCTAIGRVLTNLPLRMATLWKPRKIHLKKCILNSIKHKIR